VSTLAATLELLGNSLGIQYFLFDFENVQPTSVGSLKPGLCRIKIFLGQSQSKLPLELLRALQPFGSDVEYIQISGSGPNAVDFHIAFYIGKLAGSYPGASFTIVSKDAGFDPLVRHLKASGITCNRVAAIDGTAEAIAGPKATTKPKPAVTKSAVLKQKPAKNVVATILPEASGATSKAKSSAATSKARVAEIIKRLKGLKAARPAKLKTLQSSMQSWFKPALTAKELASVIQSLTDAKKIKVDGTKVTYSLG